MTNSFPKADTCGVALETSLAEARRFLQSTLDALSTHIAILDEHGTIIGVNAAWIRFARENDFSGGQHGLGDNYVKICETAAGDSSEHARKMAKGIQAVMAGETNEFCLEYPCHTPQQQRWFIGRATRFNEDGPMRVVVAHENITQRKKAEEALRWKTGLFEAHMNSSIDGILVTAPDGRKVLQNQRLSNLFRIPPHIADDKDDTKQIVWATKQVKDAEKFREKVAWLYAHPDETSGDEIELKDGTTLDRHTSPVLGPEGTYYGRLWTFRDITKSKQAESQLRKLSRVVVQGPVSIIITDLQGAIEYVNPKFSALTGYSFEEVRGKNPRMLKSGDMPPEAYRQMWAKITAGQDWGGEFHNRKKNGESYWEAVSIFPIRDDTGRVTHFIAIKEDITRRKALEAQMAQQYAEREIILNSIGDGVHWIDADGLIKFENPAAARMLGHEIAELLGQPAHATMHHTRADGSAYPQGECPIYATLRDRVVRRVTDEVFWRKDGTSFPVDYSCTPVYERNGRSGGTVVIFTDVTERKRAQAERTNLALMVAEHKKREESARLALEHQQKLSEIQGRFVSMVSHEFRTPLSVINMAAELLDGYSDHMTHAERSEQLNEIRSAIGRMTQMMNDFLVHGNCTSGKTECKPARVGVAALCRQIIAEVPGYPGLPRPIECAVDPEVGEVWLDEKILRHILGNLLGNAVKYSFDGQPVKLEVRPVAAGPESHGGTDMPFETYLELKVSDSGIGIPAGDLGKLYQTFHRAANVGNRPGTGMGLAIVKQFVDLHRGTIRFESEEGKGTTVWVQLPVTPPDTRKPN